MGETVKLERHCPLCELSKKLTVGVVEFWIEWSEDGGAALVTDCHERNGAPKVPIRFCPYCGGCVVRQQRPWQEERRESSSEQEKQGENICTEQ